MIKIRVDSNQILMLRKQIADLKYFAGQELSNELTTTAAKAVGRMKETAPHDNGNLRKTISFERQNDSNVAIIARAPYAPYVEFGTGRGVTLKFLQEAGFPSSYAEQFRGKGIRKQNMYARPFFFPAIRTEMRLLNIRLYNKLKKLTK
jgi:HK97 gp10 family phage protein